MQTKIISAFPGVGKTTLESTHESVLDLDSSSFSWLNKDGDSTAVGSVTEEEKGTAGRTRNPDFPQNYVAAIQEAIGKYEYILVSSHDVVRDALQANCVFYYLAYPGEDVSAEEYAERYRGRGNNEAFVNLILANFDTWVEQCEAANKCVRLPTPSGKYLSDMIPVIEMMDER